MGRMTTTPEQAREAAAAYIKENRPGCSVTKLYEDDTDYLIEVTYDGPTRIDSTFMFVRKADGKVWLGAPADVLEKVYSMDELD